MTLDVALHAVEEAPALLEDLIRATLAELNRNDSGEEGKSR
jgi:hypothetical protein